MSVSPCGFGRVIQVAGLGVDRESGFSIGRVGRAIGYGRRWRVLLSVVATGPRQSRESVRLDPLGIDAPVLVVAGRA